MNKHIRLWTEFISIIFFAIFSFLACSESPTTSPLKESTTTEDTASSNKHQPIPRATNQIGHQLKQQKKCAINGELLEGNELWLKDQGKLICIIADSSTYDQTFGMSHRILEVYNTYTCKLDLKLTLPINSSPDFPYYLADINYNNESKIVAIKAAKTILCLDLQSNKMMPLLQPKFKSPRLEVDPSSGMIIRLELWEDFLVGYAEDKGTFVFNLAQKSKIHPILPFAEYQAGDANFNALFILPSGEGKYQAIIPKYDWEEEVFSINPIFKKPIIISTDIQKSALDNRFLVLRQEKNAILVDMKEMKNSNLPLTIREKSVKEILAWVKSNGL